MTLHSLNLNGVYLAQQSIPSQSAPLLPPSVERFVVIDCSGSMSYDLPKLADHLKNNLAVTLRNGDHVTIIWFSGRNQHGVIVKSMKIDGPQYLQLLHSAIDRYLRPVGLTGFKEPLQSVLDIIDEISAERADAAFTLTFMSDGYDNQWSNKEILAVTERLGNKLAAGVVVEYGWNANRALLTQMSESLGVEYVFSEDYSRFQPVLDLEMRREVNGVRKREVVLPVSPKHGFAFGFRGESVNVFAVDKHTVKVPEDISTVYFMSEDRVGSVHATLDSANGDNKLIGAVYAAVGLLSQRMLADDVFRALRVLGDVQLIRAFTNCFGKQAYSAFQELALNCAVDPTLRLKDGYNPDLVPDENAYTVLDVLSDLIAHEGNMLKIADLNYQNIGRKTVVVTDQLTDDEKAEIAEITANARTATELDRVQRRIQEIIASKPKEVKFRSDREVGVPMNTLAFNESRPNISLQTKQDGVVELGENPVGLPEEVESFIYRNYAIIRDGILNVKVLPVTLTHDTWKHLNIHGVVQEAWEEGKTYNINLDALPIINRRMVKSVHATECFTMQFELERARAAQKVFKHYENLHFPKERAAGLKAKWGEEKAEWLKSVGVTDGGFAPKVKQAEAVDFYLGRELDVSIKGCALPKVDDVVAKIAKGSTLNLGAGIMAPYIREYQEFVASPIYANASNPEALLKTWLLDKTKFWTKRAREINRGLSEMKFSIVVGQIWFPEFADPANSVLTLHQDGFEFTTTATLKEIEVKI